MQTHHTTNGGGNSNDSGNAPPPPEITVSPFYHSVRNAIIEPDKYVACSRYFLRRWSPLLGGVGVQIVLTLRSLGYDNRKTGERRDGIEIDLPELAALVGVHPATLKRELGDRRGEPGVPANPALHQFVRRERQYWRDPLTNRLLRTANVYRIAMDDPLHPDDLPRLNALLSEMEKGAETSKAQIAPKPPRGWQEGLASKAQIAPEIVQNAPKIEQIAPQKVQNAPSLIDDLSSQKFTFDDSETLNVVRPVQKTSLRTPEHVRLANEAVALTGDERSRKRYEQLAGIVWNAGPKAGELWEAAYKATEARLTKSSERLEAPGAYFCAVLTRLLMDAEVYVPVGTPEERADIKAQIRKSLAQADAGGGRL